MLHFYLQLVTDNGNMIIYIYGVLHSFVIRTSRFVLYLFLFLIVISSSSDMFDA